MFDESDEALEEIQRLPETPTATSADAIASQGSRVARIAKYAPELWRYGKFAMGGIGGFVLTIGGEYLIAKIFSPADTPAGQIWDLNGFRLMDAGETILRSCATMDCSVM